MLINRRVGEQGIKIKVNRMSLVGIAWCYLRYWKVMVPLHLLLC
jgi:hypothetical protein